MSLLLLLPLGQAPIVRPVLTPDQVPAFAPAVAEQQVASVQVTAEDGPRLVADCRPAAANERQLVAECVTRFVVAGG